MGTSRPGCRRAGGGRGTSRRRAGWPRWDHARVSALPAGTVTFLFTDIEGSTRLLQELGDRYREIVRDHRSIVRETLAAHDGREVDTQGDAFFYSFARARYAVAGA